MTDDPNVGNPESRGRALFESGTAIVGTTTGATVGLFVGGPAGAIIGAAIGETAAQTLRIVTAEIGHRLTGRGRARAMGAVICTAERLEELRSEGAELRTDGFFDDQPDGRNAAREVAEGVLLTARDAFEERKVRHLGYMLANIAVDDSLDISLAALVLRLAETLTWRQYVLLATVDRGTDHPLPVGELGGWAGSWSSWGIHRELQDLYDARYVYGGTTQTPRMALPLSDLRLSALKLVHQGVLLHGLLSLDRISQAETDLARDELRSVSATEDPLSEE